MCIFNHDQRESSSERFFSLSYFLLYRGDVQHAGKQRIQTNAVGLFGTRHAPKRHLVNSRLRGAGGFWLVIRGRCIVDRHISRS